MADRTAALWNANLIPLSRVALAAGLGLLLAATAATAGDLKAQTTVVSVRLTNSSLIVAPSKIPTGPAVFRIVNKGTTARRFAIGDKRTPLIARGRSATLSVELSGRGPHPYVSTGTGRAARLSGVLTVFEPCLQPAVTSVNVTMDHDRSGIALSRSTLPCGTVTFVVTNIGLAVDSLQVFPDYPSAGGKTPELEPGQSARLTVRLPEKGIAYYQSGDYTPGEPEFGGGDADGGSIPIV